MPSETTFSRSTVLLFVAIQIFAAKLLVERLQDVGLIEVPDWVPLIAKRGNCGHVKEFEYVIVSRNVVTPDGIMPAAGRHRIAVQIAPQRSKPYLTSFQLKRMCNHRFYHENFPSFSKFFSRQSKQYLKPQCTTLLPLGRAIQLSL